MMDSEIMSNRDKDQEQVYQCQECGSVHAESTIRCRPHTKVLYCDQCQSEAIKLIV